MKPSAVLLDEYERHARFIPGLWSLLPVEVAIVALGLRNDPLLTVVVSLLVPFGGPVVLAGFVRQRGKRIQKRFWTSWGGAPATAMLRNGGDVAEATQRQQLRDHVSEILSVNLPTLSEEREDSVGADAAYAAAVFRLRGLAADKTQFPLLFAENKSYGYERNLLGMQPIALAVGSVCCIVLLGATGLSLAGMVSLHWLDLVLGLIVDAGLILFWTRVPSEASVHQVAEAYAEQLAQAAWKFDGQTPTATR